MIDSILPLIKDDGLLKLISYIKDAIKNTPFEGHTFIVGGTVRDCILGNRVNDVDIAVDISSGGIGFANSLAFRNGCYISTKNPVVFPAYGTAKVQLLNSPEFSHISIECVETKREHRRILGASSGKTFFGTLDQDAFGRDFTINAIYYDITNDKIIDPTHKGLSDLEHHLIRTTSDPDKIFMNDPLRVLRGIRFSTILGWGIEKETWIGMIENSDPESHPTYRLSDIPQERVTEELNKILLAKKPSIGIRKMLRCNNLLKTVLPVIYYLTHIYECLYPKVTVFDHTMDVLDFVKPDLDLRIAALFHDIGKYETYREGFHSFATKGGDLAKVIMKAMKYPSSTINRVTAAIILHDLFSDYKGNSIPAKKYLRKFKDGIGDYYDLTLDLMDANNNCLVYGKKPNQVKGIRRRIKEIEEADKKIAPKTLLPINGNDIIKNFGLKQGPLIGRLLKKVKDAYYDNPAITKEESLDLVNDIIKKVKSK